MQAVQLSSKQAVGCAAFRSSRPGRRLAAVVRLQAACSSVDEASSPVQLDRRSALQAAAALVATAVVGGAPAAVAQDLGAMTPTDGDKQLCDASCVADLAKKERIKTKSGLEYQDVVVGTGPSAPVGVQVVVDYVAMTPDGKVFDSSLAKGAPYYIRAGSGSVIAGLDEALLSMQTGTVRRLYIPGELAFPKGLASAPGRPRVPPNSPVVFDVKLVYIPGISDDLEIPE